MICLWLTHNSPNSQYTIHSSTRRSSEYGEMEFAFFSHIIIRTVTRSGTKLKLCVRNRKRSHFALAYLKMLASADQRPLSFGPFFLIMVLPSPIEFDGMFICSILLFADIKSTMTKMWICEMRRLCKCNWAHKGRHRLYKIPISPKWFATRPPASAPSVPGTQFLSLARLLRFSLVHQRLHYFLMDNGTITGGLCKQLHNLWTGNYWNR